MNDIYFYLNDDGSICRDQTQRPKVSAAQAGAARLIKKKESDVVAAVAKLGLKINLKDGALAEAGLYLVEYADGTFDLSSSPEQESDDE